MLGEGDMVVTAVVVVVVGHHDDLVVDLAYEEVEALPRRNNDPQAQEVHASRIYLDHLQHGHTCVPGVIVVHELQHVSQVLNW